MASGRKIDGRQPATSERTSSWKMLARWALIEALFARLATENARGHRAGGEISRVLVVRPDHLGDLLFATPALEAIRNAFPGARITGAVGPWGRAMWEGNRNLDELQVITFPGMVIGTDSTILTPYSLLGKTARQLARERYDLAIILRFDYWWGAALAWAAGIPRRWGYARAGTGKWLTHAIPYTAGRHEVEENLLLVEQVVSSVLGEEVAKKALPARVDRQEGAPPLQPPAPVMPPGGTLALAEGWLGSAKRVVIHPGTAAANKLWTIAGWAETASRITQEGWSVALTGSPAEHGLAEAIVRQMGADHEGVVNLAGTTSSIGELAWLLDQSDLVLGVDSGPMHIAAALSKPTLHLFGPSDEAVWGPWGDPRKHRVLRAPDTQPTMQLEVGSAAMEGGPEMRAVTPTMVMSEIAMLESYRPHARI